MKARRRAVLAWCLYDWANSAFALTVMAAFFPVLLKEYWCYGAEATVSTARLGIASTIAGILIAVLSLFFGAVADAGNAKKKFLILFALLGMACTALLFFAGKGMWGWALLIFIFGNVGFSCANLFYDALLLDVAERHEMDFVSSLGFSLGYLGCGILFLLNVFMVSKPHVFGLGTQAQAVRLSLLTAAVWWFVFSVPLLLFVKERKATVAKVAGGIIADSFFRLKRTAKKIYATPALALFLAAYWLYIDGLNTVVRMSVDFGKAIGFSTPSLMTALLAIQFVAFPAALVFGWLAGRFGAERMILAGISIYIVVGGAGALLMKTETHFIVLAALTGIGQGGVQALSRSYFGKLIPASESAEYFGFYNVVSRFAVVGPAMVGMIALMSHRAGISSQLASRLGMSSVTVSFVAGAILLAFAEARRMSAKPEAGSLCPETVVKTETL